MRSGTHRDLYSRLKVAVLHAKTTDEGYGPIETNISGANHAVLHAQNDRLCLGPIETSISGANHADLHGQYDR